MKRCPFIIAVVLRVTIMITVAAENLMKKIVLNGDGNCHRMKRVFTVCNNAFKGH